MFLDSLNKWGLPNQPSQRRRQPMRDLTKLGFADDLALVAGLEEVSRTCCPHINFIRCFYSSLGWGTLMKRLTVTTTKIRGTPLIVTQQEVSSWTKEKFHLKCSEVSFIEHVMTRNGLNADPKKVEAIIKMERPADVLAVQRFTGLVNYLSSYKTYQNCVSHCAV